MTEQTQKVPFLKPPPGGSSGIMKVRPPNCGYCRYQYKSKGFCAPFVGKDPKLALVFPTPNAEEVVNQVALDSDAGHHFLHNYIEPYGLTKENLVVTYVIKCLPPWDVKRQEREYPSAVLRQNAESVCDRYNTLHGDRNGRLVPGGIVKYDPDIFVFSFDPSDTIKIPPYTRVIRRCVERALHLQTLGYRPCVLFGTEAVELQAPWIRGRGGLKKFVGHYLEGKWKSLSVKDELIPLTSGQRRFTPA